MSEKPDKPLQYRIIDGEFYRGNPRPWTNMSHHILLAMLAKHMFTDESKPECYGHICPSRKTLAMEMHCGSAQKIDVSTVKRGLTWLQSHRYIRELSKKGLSGAVYKSRYWKIIESSDPEAALGYLDPADFPVIDDDVDNFEMGLQSAAEGVQSAAEGVQSAAEGVQFARLGGAICTPIISNHLSNHSSNHQDDVNDLDRVLMDAMKAVCDKSMPDKQVKETMTMLAGIICDDSQLERYRVTIELFSSRYSQVAKSKRSYLKDMLDNPQKYPGIDKALKAREAAKAMTAGVEAKWQALRNSAAFSQVKNESMLSRMKESFLDIVCSQTGDARLMYADVFVSDFLDDRPQPIPENMVEGAFSEFRETFRREH